MTPTAKALAQQIYVELVGRSMFAAATPTEPDGDKLASAAITLAETFERAVVRAEVDSDPNKPVKFDVQLDDIANWVAKK
jgi:hypothetical protein